VGYVGRFGHLAGKWDLVLKGRLDDPAVENYFGSGNNTIVENKKRNYYQTFSQRKYGSIGIERNFNNLHHADISLIYQSVKYKRTSDHYISNGSYIDPSIFNPKQFGGLEARYAYDRTSGSIYPTHGFTFNAGGGFLKNLADTGSSFIKLNSSAAVYLALSKAFTFALRAGGGTLFGDADFYHLNRLGRNTELRGYNRERFYGKSSFYTNTEIRWLTNSHNYFFNGRAGIFGFYDIGRVWMPDEISSLWHAGYGMGLVLIPFNKVTLTATYGLSSEGDNIFFRTELFF
jgi:hemolysin activation/secretion protein